MTYYWNDPLAAQGYYRSALITAMEQAFEAGIPAERIRGILLELATGLSADRVRAILIDETPEQAAERQRESDRATLRRLWPAPAQPEEPTK